MLVAERNGMSARWLITEALTALLAAGSFDRITVRAIVRKAGVSRSTFYVHFQDKADLLDQMTEQITGELLDLYGTDGNDEAFTGDMQDFAEQQALPGAIAICEHVRRYESFYRSRFRDPAFAARLSDRLCSRLRPIYRDETHAAFAAYGTVGYLGRWLAEGLKGSSSEVALRLASVAFLTLPQVRQRAMSLS